MFIVIRLIVCSLLFIFAIVAVTASKAKHKRLLYLSSLCVSLVIFVISTFVLIENCFVTFDSPNQAYEYYHFGSSDIELVVEGDGGDFVIESKTDSYSYLIIPKTSDGWKLGLGADTKMIAQKIDKEIVAFVYQYKNSSDYFISITDIGDGETTVTDGFDTKFYSLERQNDTLDKRTVTHYAYIPCFDSQYSITVNGREIIISN